MCSSGKAPQKNASPSATPPLHTAAAEIDIYKSNISLFVREFAFSISKKQHAIVSSNVRTSVKCHD